MLLGMGNAIIVIIIIFAVYAVKGPYRNSKCLTIISY